MPPRIENRNPETDIASPPHTSGNRLPAVDPTKKPIQTNFFVIFDGRSHYAKRIRVPRSNDIFSSSAETFGGKYAPDTLAR